MPFVQHLIFRTLAGNKECSDLKEQGAYLATFTARFSRITVIFICPG